MRKYQLPTLSPLTFLVCFHCLYNSLSYMGSVEYPEAEIIYIFDFFHHYRALKEEMKRYRKLDGINDGDIRKMQGYMKHYNLEFSRMAFRLRTRQFRCRANMPKIYGDVLWCHSCSAGPEEGSGGGPAPVESQGHL